MNQYGAIAREYWKKVAPIRYDELDDPTDFFTRLGEQVREQILAILIHTERNIDPHMPHLEKVGTLNALKQQAEEVALADLVYTIPIEYSLLEELAEMLSGLPSQGSVRNALHELTDKAEDEGWTDEMEADYAQMSALLPLITEQSGHNFYDHDQLTEAEARDWVLKLHPFWDPETQTLVSLT